MLFIPSATMTLEPVPVHLLDPENQPLLLRHARVNANGREVALDEELVELVRPLHRLHKDHDLVKLERVQQVVQLPVLFRLGQVDVVLLQSVKRELRLVVDKDLDRLRERTRAGRRRCEIYPPEKRERSWRPN